MRILVNGKSHEVKKDVRLLRFLRDELHLTSVKDGCSQGACGTCTIIIDGKAVRCCSVLTSEVENKRIITMEGLSDRESEVYSYSFARAGAVQCGFCIPGMIMCAKALLDVNPDPTEKDIRHAIRNNICRCTGYRKIVDAILLAASIFRNDAKIADDANWKVGSSVIKADAISKALGKAIYPDDIYVDGMLYAVALRSAHPCAKVLGIDISRAEKAKGVAAVYTAADVPGTVMVGHIKRDWPAFIAEGETTNYLGDVIALAVADTYEDARNACRLIDVDYEVFEPVSSLHEAAAVGARKVHENNPDGNLLGSVRVDRGDVSKALSEAQFVLTEHYSTPITEHAFLEPEAAVAIPLGNGGVRIYSTDQGVYDTRREIAPFLGISENMVEVENCCVGGGFGGKEDVSVQHYAALAAYKLRRPCKMKLTRDESLIVHPKRHPMEMDFTLGCDGKGRILALDAKVLADTGAYASLGMPVLQRACTHASGPYAYDNFRIEGKAYYTNNPPAGAFRGFGVTQTCFAMESMLNHMADRIGISHWEIRHINAIRPGQSLPNGQIVGNDTGLVEALEAVKADYESSQLAGIACAMKNAGVGVGLPDYGRVRLEVRGGKVVIHSAASDLGQGIYTVMKQVVCDVASLPGEVVEYEAANSYDAPDSGTSSGSRHTTVTGEAARRAAVELRKALDDVFENSDSTGTSKFLLQRALDSLGGQSFYAEYLAETDPFGCDLPHPKSHVAYGYAVQVAVLDEKTHKIDRIIAAHDVGRAINRVNVEGQIEGGVVMGIGYTLREDYIVNKGVPDVKYGSLGLFRADELPDIVPRIIEKEGLDVACGAKGIGEIVCIPTAPAIADAYYRLDCESRFSLPLVNTPYEKEQKSQVIKRSIRTLAVGKGPRCIGCLECMRACSLTYFKTEKRDRAFLQVRERKGKGLTSGMDDVVIARPVVCIQCGKCASACSIGAIKKNRFGTYIIDLKMCTNCGKCRDACPLSLIVEDEVANVSKKCVACGKCVKACPMGVLSIMTGEDQSNFRT